MMYEGVVMRGGERRLEMRTMRGWCRSGNLAWSGGVWHGIAMVEGSPEFGRKRRSENVGRQKHSMRGKRGWK
ncbi:hypothetical protein Tco_0693587 [Tanacetum coccineum]